MWFRSLFDALVARSARTPLPKRRPAPSVRQRPRFFRPRLEILEDRTLLSAYTVNALTDTGTGSGLAGDLRYCITNATSGNDTITFAAGLTGTIQLESPLSLNTSVAIQGPGASLMTVKSGAFTVGSAASVQISGLTITDPGWSVAGISNYGSASINDCTLSGNSVGFFNNGTAIINYSTLSGNSEPPGYGIGGGIFNNGSLTVNNSTISNNYVQGLTGASNSYTGGGSPAGDSNGGGIYMGGGMLTINSSTIADNEAAGGNVYFGYASPGNGYGGGLYIGGGTVAINNSTIADNQAIGGFNSGAWPGYYGTGYGGGIYNAAGPGALQMHDTLLADNDAWGDGSDLYGGVTSLGHNLISSTSGGSGYASSDLLNVNPQLGTLQNNGGPTQTMALLPGSPAINAGDNTNAPAYDQRGPGFPRIVGGTIDIGAFEVQNGSSNQANSLSVSGFPSTITAGGAGSFTVTAKNADGSTDTNYTDTVQFTSSDGQAVLPADYTFTAADAGVHTFSATLKTAGTQSFTVTDTTTASLTGADSGIVVKPAGASKFILNAPSRVNPGVPFSLTVTVEDAYGNAVVGYAGTIHFRSTDTRGKLPANYTFTASDNGVHAFTGLVLREKGNQKISITDTQNSSLTGSAIVDVL